MIIKDLTQKLLLTAAYLGGVTVMYLLHIPCIYMYLFHIPCFGCGMTRAVLAALRLDFAAAIAFHPMVWSIPILYVLFLLDFKPFRRPWINHAILIAIGAGFLLNWVCRLIEYL